MQPCRDDALASFNHLLVALLPLEAAKTKELVDDPDARVNRCIELVKAEASEAAALIAECAPHGRPMLAQAQTKLGHLEALKTLGEAAYCQAQATSVLKDN